MRGMFIRILEVHFYSPPACGDILVVKTCQFSSRVQIPSTVLMIFEPLLTGPTIVTDFFLITEWRSLKNTHPVVQPSKTESYMFLITYWLKRRTHFVLKVKFIVTLIQLGLFNQRLPSRFKVRLRTRHWKLKQIIQLMRILFQQVCENVTSFGL